MKIRLANVSDSEKILKIYSEYINTPITFEYTLPTNTEFKKRIENIIEVYPYLVCENEENKNEEIIGYAYAHKFIEREAGKWNAELSVYISNSYTSNGIGKKLYTILINILKFQGIKSVYSQVVMNNIKSEKLHISLGFRKIFVYNNIGYKCGKWLDLAIFEKNISEYNDNPENIIPITNISQSEIENIINNI